MEEIQKNWAEFLQYLKDNPRWYRFYDDRGVSCQVSRDFQTFMLWLSKNKDTKPKEV